MANEYVNKVILGTDTLLDLTSDTAEAADVASGKAFHLKSGAPATGTASYASAPTNFGNADKANAILYGAVDSTSTSTAFTATVDGLDALVDGTTVMLRNAVVTSAAGFTINVNNLGAKPVYNSLATGNPITPTNPTQDSTIFNINYTMMFVFVESDIVAGGCWLCFRGYDSNTNTIGYQLRTNSGNKTASDTGYRYRLWFTLADGSKWVPINTSTSTNATSNRTLNTRKIDPFGPIVYRATNGTCTAGTAIGATGIWQQYTLTIGYSYMATGFSLTFPAPVYLRCTPQSDGSAVMQDIVQALPSSNDGKIYVHLGTAYSATSMELQTEHPVYWHDGTGIRIWTGAASSGGPSPSSTTPAMDGTAAVGTSTDYARADHVHPTDTSRQATLVSGTNIKTINNESLLGSGNISISSGGSKTTWYGTSSTGSGTAAKDVTCEGYALESGAMVSVLFTQGNTAGLPTLNVNSTGAKALYVGNTNTYSDTNPLKWSSNTLVTVVYDGTQYRFVAASAAASMNQPRGASTWYGSCSTAETKAAKTLDITNFVLTTGAVAIINATKANTYTAGALTLNVSSTGAKTIYKGGAATSATNTLTWAAGDLLEFVCSGSYWYYVGGSSTEGASPSSTTPVMDGTAAVGTSTNYARADHVHPTDTSRAASTHDHGSITNAGAITSDTAAASGDKLVIADNSDSSKLKRSGIAFGSSTSTFLRNDGTWATPSGGGGGGSWTDISSDFVPDNPDAVVNAYTNGTFVYVTAFDETLAGINSIFVDENIPTASAVGAAVDATGSPAMICADPNANDVYGYNGASFIFGTIIYPVA